MTLLKKNALMEDEFCLLSEMEMLQVYGGNGSARYASVSGSPLPWGHAVGCPSPSLP